jgi:hypothetical protein
LTPRKLFSPTGFWSNNLMLLSLYSLRLGGVWRGEEDGGDPPQVFSLQAVSGPVISCYFPFTVCDWAECGGERRMEGIHPKFVLSKRFPVHAAVEQLNLPELGAPAHISELTIFS